MKPLMWPNQIRVNKARVSVLLLSSCLRQRMPRFCDVVGYRLWVVRVNIRRQAAAPLARGRRDHYAHRRSLSAADATAETDRSVRLTLHFAVEGCDTLRPLHLCVSPRARGSLLPSEAS